MAKKFVAFTTPYCGSCGPVKEFLRKTPLQGEFIDASSDDGSEKAVNMGVMGVPTVIFFDDSGEEIGRASSVQTAREIINDC